MRRFEFVEGKSSKFWEVWTDGSDLNVRFGRIGANGTAQTKSFASADKAAAEADKLVREKTAKGYVEAIARATPAQPQPKPPAPKPVEAPAPVVPVQAQAPSATPAPIPRDMPMPSGQFQMSARWRALLPKFRGEATDPPRLARDALLAKIPLRQIDPNGQGAKMSRMLAMAAAGVSTAAAMPWSLEETFEEATAEKILAGDESYWRKLFATAADPRIYAGSLSYWSNQLEWALSVCTALHGFARAANLFFETLAAQEKSGAVAMHMLDASRESPLIQRLIATASDADYALALASAKVHAAGHPSLTVRIAQLFAVESDLIDAAIDIVARSSAYNGPSGAPLLTARLSLDQALRLSRIGNAWIYAGADWTAIAIAGLAQRHGEAALPVALNVLDGHKQRDAREPVIALIRAFDSSAAFAALLDRVDEKDVRTAVDEIAAKYPALTLKLAAERRRATRSRPLEAWLTRFAAAHRALVPTACAALNPETARYLEEMAAKLDLGGEEAGAELLPDVLRSPPWTVKSKKAPNEALAALVPIEQADEMVWGDLRTKWLASWVGRSDHSVNWVINQHKGVSPGEAVLKQLGMDDAALRARVLAGARPAPSDYKQERYHWNHVGMLQVVDDKLALTIWETSTAGDWHEYRSELEGLVAHHDLAFLPGLLRYIQAKPERGLEIAIPFRSARIAPLAADALRRTKKAKLPAQRWLLAHAEHAAVALLPAASLAPSAARDDAEYALRWLANNGRRDEVESAAARYGGNGKAVLTRVLDFDPLSLYPSRMPKLPAFFVAGGLARPRLTSGEALPVAAAEHLGAMLAISSPDHRYAGLDVVASACTAESLAEFCWDLFMAWLQSGAPNKEQWAFTALGQLGNDESARRLSPLIRQWPGEAAHARAVVGLQVLSMIGTDVALMHLNGIAQKVKFKGLQEKARERIAGIAEMRGLTTEELADRLVPDLGLDSNGTMVLDFGPRQFTVGFDEQLRPFVRDAHGARLKDLPKPGKADDAERSSLAADAWKGLKKDVRTLAAQQIRRFELAMSDRRRWKSAEFRLFMVEHPLLRHLVQRVLWGVYVDGRCTNCFRVAEDSTFADRDDATWTLADDAIVGIVHPLDIDAATASAFGQVFADYEILQPFRQLGRESYSLAPDEVGKLEVARFAGKKVPTGSVFGLENKGWRRGQPQDGGWIGWFERPLANGIHVELELDPGTVVGDIGFEPQQTLKSIILRRDGTWHTDGRIPLSDLDPIVASELLRDLDLLA